MKKYNFDYIIDRRHTGAMKYDGLAQMFGRTDVTPLWIADLDFAVCPDIIDALHERLNHPVLGYSAAPESYWQSIIDWEKKRHGFEIKREELTFIPGVVKGIALALNYFTAKGDKVIIQPPVYHPFRMVIEGNERVVVENPLKFSDSKYSMDLADLEAKIKKEKPKMMILCNPHNPIGLQWNKETLAEVGRICQENNVIVVSDEIHGDLMLGGRKHISFAESSPASAAVAITLGAPSKTFNIPGLVSSWMVVKDPILRAGFYNWLTVNEFNSPVMISTIGAEAAYRTGEEWLDQMLEYVEDNVEYVDQYLRENCPSVTAVLPEVSFLVWLDFSQLGLSQEELMKLLVEKAHVAMNDGAMFGRQGVGYVRLNVGTPRSVLKKALDSIAAAVNS